MSDPFAIDDDAFPPAAPQPRAGGLAARAMAAASPAAKYLAGLNPEQREAVETLDGPVLVLAGAGTGKTRVLTTRIAHIITTNRAYPSQILSVTFTNKAAREMKERIGHLLGGVGEGMPWLGTFHSISTKILRRHAELVGLRTDFTILDTDDQIRLMKQVIAADDIDEKRWPARILASMIDGWKNRALTPAKVPAGEAQAFANGRGQHLYSAYQARLKTLNACDFGDLLLECIRLFQENTEILAQYQDRFRYILVDEYQDTNVAQYLWLRLLAQRQGGRPQNVCCVGDDDQCVVAGTRITMADGSVRAIEDVNVGDAVLSSKGSGELAGSSVTRVHHSKRNGSLIKIKTESGAEIISTPEHMHFAGYRLGITPQMHFVYLMQKDGLGFRIGTSQTYTKGQKKPMVGFLQRSLQEKADALWVVGTCRTENDARLLEMQLSLSYGLPTLPFMPRKGKAKNGIVHDKALIRQLYTSLDTEAAADRLLEDQGLSPAHPHHMPQSRHSSRRQVTLTLCGDRRGKTPMHRLSIVGNDREGAKALEALGFSVRSAKKGMASWRVETANQSWLEVAAAAEKMREAFDLRIIRKARLGADNAASTSKASNSLPFTHAASVRPGMAVFVAGSYDTVATVERIEAEVDVYDLDVANTHNYIANGIITHNSIYGWRGAEVDNILRFDKDFPAAKVIKLERNYRSTGHILATASRLITNNDGRLGKTLFTDGDEGDKVTVSGAWDSEEEARLVGEEIEALHVKKHQLNEIAILVRASFQMREFEERFITLGLPYRVIGGPRFYERREVRDALAYFRIVAQPANDLAFERIINTPKRGLGDATLNELHAYSRNSSVPMVQATRELLETEEFKPKVRQTLRDLVLSFDRWTAMLETHKHTEVAEIILEESGYTDMWKKDRSADAAGRLENLKELVRSMEDFENMQGFLEHVSLVMEVAEGESEDRVTLMTLHGAKGLEFETVFLPGWEEGVFPHPRALDEQGRAGLEEERRLAYVGLTRAKQRAKIYFASNRRIHGSWNASIPSRFVDELPEAHVEVVSSSGPSFAHGRGGYLGGGESRFDRMTPFQTSSYSTPGWQRAQARSDAPKGGNFGGGNTGGFDQGPQTAYRGGASPARKPMQIEGQILARSSGAPSRFGEGARVFHVKFGNGTVVAVDGNKLTVDFDKAGRKMVIESYVEGV
ncbi:MAG: UvrD-helicase domain-containing protein [Beijerinckiaceae bacterium]